MYKKQIQNLEDRKKDLQNNINKEKSSVSPLNKAIRETTVQLADLHKRCQNFVRYHERTLKYLSVI